MGSYNCSTLSLASFQRTFKTYTNWLSVSTYFPDTLSPDEWISQAEAARLRNVSRQAIGRLISRGRLRTATVGGYVLVSRNDVMSFTPRSPGRPPKPE
ncbi:MAG: helix-turn-helix domain-containing protein [Cyanobacteria bacterium]|nr:helix-turn-helix domain-containing protein [Cyanobacteriota bacterium]